MFNGASAQPEPGLANALQTALSHYPAVKGQQAQLSAQHSAINVAKAARYPSMYGELTSEEEDYSYLQLTQPLWSFGKISAAIDTEQVNYELQKQTLRQVQRELMANTAAAYAAVRSAELNIKVAKDNVAEHQRLYDRIKRREKGHLASKADVRLANARLLQAKSELLSYQSNLKSAQNELQTFTLKPVSTELPISEALLTLPEDQAVKERAKAESADTAHAQQQINLAQATLNQQKKAPFPTLSLSVQQYLFDYSDETRVGLVLEGGLDGMGFSAYGEIEAAKQRINAAIYELESVQNEVQREVSNLLINRQLQLGLRQTQAETVAAMEQTMASFLRQYETNRKSWVELLNQQRELSNMRHTLIGTDREWTTLSLRIAALIGLLDQIAGVNE